MALPLNSLYSLTWGDYGTSLVSAIQLLRCHGDLVDCTLAAGGRSFPAHKIVLCAASPFLFELLKNTPCKHPVVMLAGVNANDLEALLEFVYRGEVSVDHSQLPSLLQAAHCLNIQGLAPQTVTKDDYTTQIQLHQMMPQHHVKTVLDDQEQLIATIATPQQTVHAQVVEDISNVQTISAPSTVVSAPPQDVNVKEIINQYLPARKRKPRAKKQTATNVKVARTDGMDNVMTTTTSTIITDNTEIQQQNQQQQQQQQQQQAQHHQQQIQTVVTQSQIVQPVVSVPQQQIVTTPIKSESQTETILTVTDSTISPIQTNLANVTTGKVKNDNNKTRSRSQSEQPATCPICYAVIRQSRNLRRHLELRHFAKPGVKKERKAPSAKKGTTTTSGNANTNNNNGNANNQSGVPQIQTVQTMHTLQGVQVKKEPDSIATTSNIGGTPVTVTVAQGQQQQQQQQIQQLQQIATIDQSGQISTTGGNGQQQIVTQTENTDGTTSLSIAHVQTLQGHPLTLGNLNQVNINDFNH